MSGYSEPQSSLSATWKRPGAILRRRFDEKRFATLVAGAEKYLSDGGSLDSLSVLRAEELNLIPKDSLVGPPTLVIPGLPDRIEARCRSAPARWSLAR